MNDSEGTRHYWTERAATVLAQALIEDGGDATPRSLAHALDAAGLGGQEFSVQIDQAVGKQPWVRIERLGVPLVQGFVNNDISNAKIERSDDLFQ